MLLSRVRGYLQFLPAFFLVAALVAVLPAHAVEVDSSGSDGCDKPRTRTEKMLCLSPEVQDVDGVLNRVFLNIKSEIGQKCGDAPICGKLKTHLRTSQLRWTEYRDSFCELETMHIEDQDESDLSFSSCLISETRRKIEDLRVEQLGFRQIYKQQSLVIRTQPM